MNSLPPPIEERLRGILQWKSGLLPDIVLAAIEALLVLVISHIYWVIPAITHALETPDSTFETAFVATFESMMRPSEVIIYMTAILSASFAYLLIRLRVLKRYTGRVVFILCGAGLLMWLATPLYVAGLKGAPSNEDFAHNLALGLGLAALLIWYYALFNQRRLLERGVHIDGNRRGDQIARNVERS